MKLAARLSVPAAAAAITVSGLIGVPNAGAATVYCTYKVVNAPSGGLPIRSAPSVTAHAIAKVPNGTTEPGSQSTTNGYRTFHGGWANGAYLVKVGSACFE